MPTRHLIVQGRVQGVGFRYFVHREATLAGVRGWVRNLPRGEVEILASGTQEQLEALLQQVKQGPPLARVDHILSEERTEESHETFHVR